MTKPYTGVTSVTKPIAIAAAVALVFMLSAGPANAQTTATPPVVVDRTAVTLTYTPTGATTTTNAAVSWRFDPKWDLLLSYVSAPAGLTAFRFGGRYHVAPPGPSFDAYLTLQDFSPSTGTSRLELGGGLIQTLAPGLKSYAAATYVAVSGAPYIAGNVGFQYVLNRQFALVAGYDLSGAGAAGYVGINFDFSTR